MNTKLVGLVVLYNPEINLAIRNIKSYVDIIDKIYIVDNTERNPDDPGFLEILQSKLGSSKFEYIAFNINLGIGKALNTALERSYDEGYEFLLTMDQDSYFVIEEKGKFIDEFEASNKKNLGVFSPLHEGISKNRYEIKNGIYITMTSGNLVNVPLAIKMGKFESDFFIDHIDHYYCLKIQEKGFRVVFSNAILQHELGNKKSIKGRNYVYHSPRRFYYFLRNGLYTQQKFPVFKYFFARRLIVEFFKLIIIELKIYSTFYFSYYAIKDYLSEKKGSFEL